MFNSWKIWDGIQMQIQYTSHVARKRFFGVHARDPPACIHVDTELNTSLLI